MKILHRTYNQERYDYNILINNLKESGFISPNMVIINCFPDFSSYLSQMVNHKLSYLNNNELFDQLNLELPYSHMKQVYNKEEGEWQSFIPYLFSWANKNIVLDNRYLFLSLSVRTGKNFQEILKQIRNKLDVDDFRFATVYLEQDSLFHPELYAMKYNEKEDGKLLFEWQNSLINF